MKILNLYAGIGVNLFLALAKTNKRGVGRLSGGLSTKIRKLIQRRID